MTHDSLGDRMKGYEAAFRYTLTSRMPVIIRVDGKAFHTYTRGCKRPFDQHLGSVMADTAKRLCEEIQGAQLAYTQSDEISVLVHGYKRFNTQSWFENQVQKMVSVAAGIASSYFTANSWRIWLSNINAVEEQLASIRPAVFDARAFIVPEADVCNYFLWRQQDAIRNSVQMLARSLYSHKECDKKNAEQLREMCAAKGSDWDSLHLRWQRGVCIRRAYIGDYGAWLLDDDIPIFSQNREYINNLLKLEEE